MTKTSFILALSVLALAGCASKYDHEEVSNVSQTSEFKTPGSITLQAITLNIGEIKTATVIPYNDDHKPMVGIVQSDNPNIVLVEGAEGNKWAFSGVNIGTTTVHFLSDGVVVASCQATVNDQQ